MKQAIILSSGCLALIFALAAGMAWYRNNYARVNTFEECQIAGYTTQEGYPPVCFANGKRFIGN